MCVCVCVKVVAILKKIFCKSFFIAQQLQKKVNEMLMQYLQGFDLIKFFFKFTTSFEVLCTAVTRVGNNLLEVIPFLSNSPKKFCLIILINSHI